MFRITRIFTLLVVTVLMPAARLTGQDEPGQPQSAGKDWLLARQSEFQRYELSVVDEESQPLKLEPRSLLNWSNAERGADVGALFLWTRQGRPQLIACAFGRDQSLRHEFHSLSEEPLRMRRSGSEVHRFEPGLAWQKLPDAPAALGERPLRLAQMRRQAQRFRVVMGKRDAADMRLLTQPVFRSPAELDEDIALFVFVQGTDPECVLHLAVSADGWKYCLTRQTKWPLRVELDETQVAEFPSIGKTPAGSTFFVLAPEPAQK